MAPGSDAHGAIQSEIGALLRNHLLEQRSPCRVVTDPASSPESARTAITASPTSGSPVPRRRTI